MCLNDILILKPWYKFGTLGRFLKNNYIPSYTEIIAIVSGKNIMQVIWTPKV